MGLSDVDIAKVAQVVKEAMAEGSSEQVKQIRQLQAQVTTMRLEMPPPPPRDGGDGGGRKRARSTKAPSPRDRALDGKWVLQLDPFNVDNLGELTSMYGIAAKLTQFLAGTRIKLLTEGVSNAENNFNMLKAMVSFCHGARPALCTPRPELASLAKRPEAPSLPPVRQWTETCTRASPRRTTRRSRPTSTPSSLVPTHPRRARC